jgi:hypothetical protein
MSTAAQAQASRANGALSQGPTSESGKANSSKNALKTGLTGRTVLLPSDDAALYETHILQFLERYSPAGDEELALVQSLADTEWRLQRIPSLEMGIYALGRLEFAGLFPEEDEAVRRPLIEAKIFLHYKRDLGNLSIQESRLRRQKEKDEAKLKEIQALRHQKEQAAAQPQPLGFEFTAPQSCGARASALPPDFSPAQPESNPPSTHS